MEYFGIKHERSIPNPKELRRLEEIEKLIREDDDEYYNDFKLEMGKNYTIDNGMVVSFDLSMEDFDDPVLELVAQFTSLKKLCLAYIGNLPDSFTNLNLLEEIDLSENKFEEFPKVLSINFAIFRFFSIIRNFFGNLFNTP